MTDDNDLSGFSFFSHGEFTLCQEIYEFMRHNKEHVYLSSPSFGYDDIFIKRLGNFLKSSKSEIIILKKTKNNSDHFIQKLIEKFGVENDPHPIKSMVREIHRLYKNNHKLIFICAGIDYFAEQDVKSLQEFCDTISEKYPTEKNNFFRFVFIGAPHEYALYKKFQNKDVKLFETSRLMPYDCINFLALQDQNPPLDNGTYENAALDLHHISAQSFSGFRKIIPMHHMIFSKDDKEKEKNNQFLTEIVTGDLSQAEKEIFFDAQKNAARMFHKDKSQFTILCAKIFFIFACLLGSILIWYNINGI